MTKPLSKTIKLVPDQNQGHEGPGSTPSVPVDTTKGHRDDEKHNIRERQSRAEHEQQAIGSIQQRERSGSARAEPVLPLFREGAQ
jgi:hypothetical protein